MHFFPGYYPHYGHHAGFDWTELAAIALAIVTGWLAFSTRKLARASTADQREQLDALLSPELDVAEQRERWGRVKKLAPALSQTSQPLIETLATAAVRAAI